MNKTTYGVAGHVSGQLPRRAPAQGLPLPLRREQSQLLPLLLGQSVAIADFVVVRRQLLQQLPDAIPFPDGVDVRNFVFRKRREIEVHLEKAKRSD